MPTSATMRSPISKSLTFLPFSTTLPIASWPGISCTHVRELVSRVAGGVPESYATYRELGDELALVDVAVCSANAAEGNCCAA